MSPDTIFALSSGAVPSGIAVIRISGPGAGEALRAVSGRDLPTPRRAVRVTIADPETGEHLDEALALWFSGPGSATGEDVAELHVHGGRAVVSGVLGALGACPGLRPAEPGEFSRRAFEAGKLDLTAVEGLADLIQAETTAQRRQALRQMGGELGRLYEAWRERLLRARAQLEATIDFSDEDLPAGLEDRVREEVVSVAQEITTHLADHRQGELLRSGVHIAIIGPPNAGKSSLLNLLARREAAIVSETAGTTRDVIEVHLDLGGYPVVVADTAGLRGKGANAIEDEGIRRAWMRAEDADIRLVVLNAEDGLEAVDPATVDLVDQDSLVVVNKVDLVPGTRGHIRISGVEALAVSVKTGQGVEDLLGRLGGVVEDRCAGAAALSLTRVRHRRGLEDCGAALDRFGQAGETELAAEELRVASQALGRVTGAVGVEDLLDVIFEDFCIGK